MPIAERAARPIAVLDSLLPLPRAVAVHSAAAGADSVQRDPQDPARTDLEGIGPDSEAWRILGGPDAAAGPEAYVLRVDDAGGAVLAAATEAGLLRGRWTLRQLRHAPTGAPAVTVRDEPALTRRGVVEGFYGDPWTHAERVDFLRFAERVGINEYVYAPKDDPFHRERWRDPYPARELADLAELTAIAREHGVRLIYAVAPALDMTFSEPAEHAALAEKADQLWAAGVRSFSLLFDDVPPGLAEAADVERFGDGPEGAGRAHGDACARFQEHLRAAHRIAEALPMCPTDYAGCADSPYRSGLRQTLPDDAIVMWTGADIVVGEVTRADIDAAAASYGRPLLLWDNFPVNDFDRSRLFLGPLLGRTTDLAGSALVGIVSNPMVEAAPSRFALASAADWAWNPAGYDPARSSSAAVLAVAGRHADAVEALVRACSAWPPEVQQSPELDALAADALAGDPEALDAFESALSALATLGDADAATVPLPADDALGSALGPWIAAARAAGRAGVLACRLLRRLPAAAGPVTPPDSFVPDRDRVREAQAEADEHFPNVLRSLLPEFVHDVLRRTGAEDLVPPRRLSVLMLTSGNPAPGDRHLVEQLTARGAHVTVTGVAPGGDALGDVDLLLVTPSVAAEEARAVASAPVPLLAWGRHDTLGLSRTSGVMLAQEEVEIVAEGHPLTAGLAGTVRVYRGLGKLTWCEPGEDGVVVARLPQTGQPVLVHYDTGATLADGTTTAADRVAFFLTREGFAPWLLTPDGAALFFAAVDSLTEGRRPTAGTVGTVGGQHR